jgi:energy-coupling factor transporter ATP-binding protein EcfA2
MKPQKIIREEYEQKVAACARELAVRRRQDLWLGRLRVATFLPAIGLAYYGLFHAKASPIWLIAAAALVVAFMIVVRIHERALRAAAELCQRLEINETQLARLDRRWERLPATSVEVPPQYEAVANDLDLFGQASLYQLASQAHTPFGRDTLRDWLLAPASVAEIAERQQAVKVLAPLDNIREEICLRGRMLGADGASTSAFVDWAEGPALLGARPWLKWLSRISASILVLALLGGLIGVIPTEAAFLAIAAITILHVLLNAFYGGRVYDVLDRISTRSHDIRQYRPLFETIAAFPSDVSLFARLHTHMGRTPHEPLDALAGLMRLVRFANLRRDGIFGLPYYLSQLFVLTDFHVLSLMERWQQQHGPSVRHWLEGVGRTEAISSLATLAHDNPHWGIPVVDERPDTTIVARQLGHPLIAEEKCKRNDVEVGPAGTFVLVTGSNMSGKSTLLRAVGLNIILAQAGAPVCAEGLRTPLVQLATSMRTRDSLAGGVSFFMAELRRLKEIVDQSHGSQQNSHRCLYLLDEILQGTNSAERHIAVSHIIGHLIKHGSLGMVSTHDLELAHSPSLATACRTVHFRESITGQDGDEQMTFDYILRPGVSPTTNALKLLKFVGLGD